MFEAQTEWIAPDNFPDLSGYKLIAIDLETRDPDLKSKGSGAVTGNGDVKSYDDAKRMIEFTKCKSVMIGRGAIGNPWVFNNSLEKLSYEEKDLCKKKTIINHLQQIKNYFPKKNLDMQIKKNLSYYAKGFYNSREIRQKIFRSSDSIENVIELFFKLFDRNVEKNKLEKISV